MKCADYLEYVRTLTNIARNADERDPHSIRMARQRMTEVKEANPEFAAIASTAEQP